MKIQYNNGLRIMMGLSRGYSGSVMFCGGENLFTN